MADPVDPLTERVTLATVSPADQSVAGFARFQTALASQSARATFDSWRDNPVTRLVRDVVRDLALHNARLGFPTDSLLVHHGMTIAFTYVQQLMEDPSLVVPGVFGTVDGMDKVSPPSESYDTPPDMEV